MIEFDILNNDFLLREVEKYQEFEGMIEEIDFNWEKEAITHKNMFKFPYYSLLLQPSSPNDYYNFFPFPHDQKINNKSSILKGFIH